MLNNILRDNTSYLSRQLVSSILILYFIIAVAFTGFQLTSEFHYEKKRLALQVTQIAETIRPALVEALWNFDTPQLEATMTGAYQNSEVYGIKVVGEAPDPWRLGYTLKTSIKGAEANENLVLLPVKQSDIEFKNTRFKDDKILDFRKPGIELYSLTFPLIRIDEDIEEKIGFQTLYFSSNTIYQRVWWTFAITVIGSVIKTLALWVISIFVITKLVSRPLNELTQAIKKFSLDSQNAEDIIRPQITHKKKNELSFLQKTFENFCGELIDRNRKISYNEDSQKTIIAAKTRYLQEITQKLTKANQVKSDFLSSMTHELRTPLNAVIGCSQLLQKEQLSEKEQRLVENIYNSSQTLLVLIADILDISKIEAGKLELENIVFDITHKVSDTVESLRILAENKGLDYHVHLPTHNQHSWLLGDPTRVVQVVNNLVSNAIKFTASGHIEFSLSLQEIDNENAAVSIHVFDTGIGMTEEQKDKLFQVFSQADTSTTRKYGGTGLGLAISKRIVEEMGGTIEVETAPGVGTKFFIELSLPNAEKPDIQTQENEIKHQANFPKKVVEEDIQSESTEFIDKQNPYIGNTSVVNDSDTRMILLVDDVELNREVAGFMLEDAGFSFMEAEDGEQACEKVASHHQELSAILMDCQMPVLDGYSATERIRQYEKDNALSPIPILALTANATKESQDKCLMAGMDDFITKPIEETCLIDTINKFVNASINSNT